ncbi:MAG TPA: hypothetical protein VFE58_14675 [Tepidisphaeraceae bacterium]|nr:hypothetical protein [Tepidisphaeraceae bacterium]
MQRLISLFATTEHEPRLSQPTSGPPPTPEPDYEKEPEYFEHLLVYLREQKRVTGAPADLAEEREAVYA